MNEELKPCPFCGSKAELLIVPTSQGLSGSNWIVRCTKCYCNRGVDISDHDAVERWNERMDEVTE